MGKDLCPLCKQECHSHYSDYYLERYECPNCGTYSIDRDLADDINDSREFKPSTLAMLSGYANEMNDLGKRAEIHYENYKDILSNPLIPTSPLHKFEKYVLHVYRNTKWFGNGVPYDFKTYATCYALNPDECRSIIKYCEQSGLVRNVRSPSDPSDTSQLTYEGLSYVEDLLKTKTNSKSTFVAMWFSDETMIAYEHAIKPAIEAEASGSFKAFRVDNHEHNNDITDEIIAGIKECHFMVADFTGYRGGVYYEAGFARGLGKPVIYTCEKSWFDGVDEKPKVHFDLSHQNFIIWEQNKLEDFRQRLINRIRATIV